MMVASLMQATLFFYFFKRYIFDVEKYIKTEYSKHLSYFHETQYELQYVKVTASSSVILEISRTIKKQRNNLSVANKRVVTN